MGHVVYSAMIYSWQTVNHGNLGEQVCRPSDYFDLGAPVTVLPHERRVMPTDGPVIFGASGLLYPEIAPVLEATIKAKGRYPVIGWGIGHNTHGGEVIVYPDWLKGFDLLGLRDWGTSFRYVPCPSCMHPAFDVQRKAAHSIVIYDQIDFPVGLELPGVPRENNCHPPEDMDKVISFLASGNTILTSSYHGAYWGMLLNRRVLIWKPWSTKFATLKPGCASVDGETWGEKILCPQDHSGYLELARFINTAFAERVRALIMSAER